jgi:hypothetical protein
MAQRDNQTSPVFQAANQTEVEHTLDGAYRWNAQTAKYGVVWVWLTGLVASWFAASSTIAIGVGICLLVKGKDVQILNLDPFAYDTWILWLGAGIALLVATAFFALIYSAVLKSHQTSIKLAKMPRP